MNRLLFILFFSYIFSDINLEHRCNFSDSNFFDVFRNRPQLDTSFISSTGHFKIHFDTIGVDAPIMDDINANNIPDYVEEVAIIAEYSRDVIVNIMGFNAEPDDEDGVYDIYIEDRGNGSYGFNAIDNLQIGSTYIVIDDEYEESDYFIPGINTMRLTVAHEFFHAIQRSYRISPSNSTLFLYEMSSTWIEDVIVPDGNDYLFWVDNFFNNSDQDIDDTNGYSIALFGHYLTQVVEQEENQMESSIIKEIWENFQNINNAHISINNTLNNYNNSFSESWTDFCARNLFNGKYSDMNNSIYYYSDQIYANPIYTNPIFLNQSQYINDIIINDKSIAPILSYDSEDFFILEHNTSINENDYFGLVVIEKYNTNDVDIVKLDNLNSYNLNENDKVHFLYSSYNNSRLMDVEILLQECDINNPPLGFCDCNGSILDQCGICNGDNLCFPEEVSINNIYPNPFIFDYNNFINIEYELPQDTQVNILIYDLNGELITSLINKFQNGRENPYLFSWDPRDLSSGIYLVNLLTDKQINTLVDI